jgi:hypothetical protein
VEKRPARATGHPSSRPNSRSSSSRSSDRKPSDRRPSDRASQRGPANRPSRPPMRPNDRRVVSDENKRVRKFAEPPIPEEVTGKELEKREAFALQSLAPDNAERVAKHLVALTMFLETDPERAYWHGQSAAFRAGRVAIVRERAGIAALNVKKYQEAQKELRAAQRISGSPSVIPYLAHCELALGNPRKTLEIAGSVDPKILSSAERVELRLAASGARTALGQRDAAVVTLTCPELAQGDALWSKKLRRAYCDALIAAGRDDEAVRFTSKYPETLADQ